MDANRIAESLNIKSGGTINLVDETKVKSKTKGFIVPKFMDIGEIIGKTDILEFMKQNERSPATTRQQLKPLWWYNTPYGVPRGINPKNLRILASSWIFQMCVSVYQSDLRAMKYVIKPKDQKMAKEKIVIEAIKEVNDYFELINNDGESIQDLWEKWIKDILEIDAGVFVTHFRENAYVDIKDDHGNVIQQYIPDDLKAGRALEITTEDGSLFFKDYYDDGQLMGYWHHNYTTGKPVFFGKRQISYTMFNPSTYSPYGWSKVQQLYDVLIAMVSSVLNTSEYMSRGAVPAGLIELRGADEDEANSFRDYWRRKVQGKPHKFAIIGTPEGGQINFIPLNFSIDDITFLDGLDFFWRVVLATCHVSPNEVGLTNQINKSNSESQERVVTRNQKMPMFTKIERIMNVQFMKDITIYHDLIEFVWEVPEDVAKERQKDDIVHQQLLDGRITLNEARLDAGDDPYTIPEADIPLNLLQIQMQQQQLEQGGIGGFNASNELSNIAQEIESMGKSFKELKKNLNVSEGEELSDNIDSFAVKEENTIRQAIITTIRSWFDKVKEMVSSFMQRNPNAELNTALISTIDRMSESGSQVLMEIRQHLTENLTEVYLRAFNTNDMLDGDLEAFRSIPREALRFIEAHSLIISEKLTTELGLKVKQEIIESMSKGESIPKMAKRIQESIKSSKNRAETIARTEVNRAMNNAHHARMESDGATHYIFHAHIDSRTDPICGARHEKKFPIDKTDMLPPVHPRCRCTIISVIPDDD